MTPARCFASRLRTAPLLHALRAVTTLLTALRALPRRRARRAQRAPRRRRGRNHVLDAIHPRDTAIAQRGKGDSQLDHLLLAAHRQTGRHATSIAIADDADTAAATIATATTRARGATRGARLRAEHAACFLAAFAAVCCPVAVRAGEHGPVEARDRLRKSAHLAEAGAAAESEAGLESGSGSGSASGLGGSRSGSRPGQGQGEAAHLAERESGEPLQ